MSLSLQQRIHAFVQLGQLMDLLGNQHGWPGFACGLTEEEYAQAEETVKTQVLYNGWFTESNTRLALSRWAEALTEPALSSWLAPYAIEEDREAHTVAIICAGNIPMVGFHDILCTLLVGDRALIKLSADDARLIPLMLFLLQKWEPSFAEQILWAQGKLENFDRVIATGSNNTARYFEQYFAPYPHLFRKSRTSVAVLDGTETEQELAELGKDIFDYFGLGCRNVCKVYLPQGYDINTLIGALYPHREIINHNKYANNYDYIKAVWLLNHVPLLENGFMLFKEDSGLSAPTGSLFYEYFSDRRAVLEHLQQHDLEVQCVVGHGLVPFGQAQCPRLMDYADHVDTLSFLLA